MHWEQGILTTREVLHVNIKKKHCSGKKQICEDGQILLIEILEIKIWSLSSEVRLIVGALTNA